MVDTLKALERKHKSLLQKKYELLFEIKSIQTQIEQEKFPTGEYEKVLGKLYDGSNLYPPSDIYKIYKNYYLPFKIISCDADCVKFKAKIFSYIVDQDNEMSMDVHTNRLMRIGKSEFYDDLFNDKNIVNNPEDEIQELMSQGAQQFLLDSNE